MPEPAWVLLLKKPALYGWNLVEGIRKSSSKKVQKGVFPFTGDSRNVLRRERTYYFLRKGAAQRESSRKLAYQQGEGGT